jgi:hypothetical protein
VTLLLALIAVLVGGYAIYYIGKHDGYQDGWEAGHDKGWLTAIHELSPIYKNRKEEE